MLTLFKVRCLRSLVDNRTIVLQRIMVLSWYLTVPYCIMLPDVVTGTSRQAVPIYIHVPKIVREALAASPLNESSSLPRNGRDRSAALRERRRMPVKSVRVEEVFDRREYLDREFASNPNRRRFVPFMQRVLATQAFSCFLHACIRSSRARLQVCESTVQHLIMCRTMDVWISSRLPKCPCLTVTMWC